jgi:hypothetical protein
VELAQLQLALLPAAARQPPATHSTAIGHGDLCRFLRQIVRDEPPAGQGVAARAAPALDGRFAEGGGPPGRH